jgi:uncharacterized protein (UPF0248 family)
MAISANNDKNYNKEDKKQQTRVVSTKITVDQYLSFNRLAEHLFKNGVVEKPLMSTVLRDSINKMLNHYHRDLENYRIVKIQDSESDENKQESLTSRNQENTYQKQSHQQDIPNIHTLQELQRGIPHTSTYQETSTPSTSVDHSDGVQQIQGEKRIKEDDLETEKLLQDIMLDFIISPYTTTNCSRKRIPISPHLSELVHEFVQDLGNKIMPAANAFDKIYKIAKEENFPIDALIKDREKLKELLGFKDIAQGH